MNKEKFEEHMSFCGSRTELCSSCKKYIQLKDKILHEDSNCKLPAFKEPLQNRKTSN